MTTIGEALIHFLEAQGITHVFGIPGVHTLGLYRALAASGIRHITPRHEQGAGFMADGYARASGKPGVAFVITGPGITNVLTPMAQARADSVPMLIVSSVNETDSLGKGMGHLHELPDQQGVCGIIAKKSIHIGKNTEFQSAIEAGYGAIRDQRPGPVHVQIPLDVLDTAHAGFDCHDLIPVYPQPDVTAISEACQLLCASQKTVILAGGGAKNADCSLRVIAEKLDAPVIQTTNARGLLYRHPLALPASPSLKSVRELLSSAELVLAVGTELSSTDCDMYRDHKFPDLQSVIRIDVSERHRDVYPGVFLHGDAHTVLEQLNRRLTQPSSLTSATARLVQSVRESALAGLSVDYQHHIRLLETLRDFYRDTLIIGDSTQPIYAGNLYYEHDRPGGWFNSATGYGALGFGIPAAIGAAFAFPDKRIICITGDGGAQFVLAELMTAAEENLAITFIVWNNHGYYEIEKSMRDADIQVVGCNPVPPDFCAVSRACNIAFYQCENSTEQLVVILGETSSVEGPVMIEVAAGSA